MNKICIHTLALFLSSGLAIAQTVQVPNTFQADTPARASEVNDNFTAVETAVDDNASNIAVNVTDISDNATTITNNAAAVSANDVDIQANSNAIAALAAGGGLQIYSQGASIGRLVNLNVGGDIWIISQQGYLFFTALTNTTYLREATLLFSGAGCTGTLYMDALEWTGVTGTVIKATGSSGVDNYYIPRGSVAVTFTLNSSKANDVCFNETINRQGFEVFPNDEAITGVPDTQPVLPLVIGLP